MALVTIDTNNISEMDREILSILTDGAQGSHPAKSAAADKPAATKAAAPAEPAGPTLEDAIARATKMVSEGQTAAVKAALSSVGAKRVSELEADKVPAFLDALDV